MRPSTRLFKQEHEAICNQVTALVGEWVDRSLAGRSGITAEFVLYREPSLKQKEHRLTVTFWNSQRDAYLRIPFDLTTTQWYTDAKFFTCDHFDKNAMNVESVRTFWTEIDDCLDRLAKVREYAPESEVAHA